MLNDDYTQFVFVITAVYSWCKYRKMFTFANILADTRLLKIKRKAQLVKFIHERRTNATFTFRRLTHIDRKYRYLEYPSIKDKLGYPFSLRDRAEGVSPGERFAATDPTDSI